MFMTEDGEFTQWMRWEEDGKIFFFSVFQRQFCGGA